MNNRSIELTEELGEVNSAFDAAVARGAKLPLVVCTGLDEKAIAKSHRSNVTSLYAYGERSNILGFSGDRGIEELEPHLHIDDKLDFFREPDNPHDAKAIVVKNDDGIKIGYVPKADNVIFSRLMDAGKMLFARITKKEIQGNWLKIDIKVFLHE